MREPSFRVPTGRVVGLVLATTLCLGGCGPVGDPPGGGGSAKPSARRPTPTAELAARGKDLFAAQCAVCHGETGRGDGRAAYLLYPKPRDFVTSSFRLVSTETGPTDDDLFKTISRGMPGSAMPSWAHLPERDRWALVTEVRRLARDGRIDDLLAEGGFERAEAVEIADELVQVGTPFELPRETIRTIEELERGKVLYLQNCAPCHDADGRGRARRDLVDNAGVPIFARDFTRGVFKASAESQQIAYRILAGLPGTPMPAYSGTLLSAPEDLWAIVHFVQSLIPDGAQERVSQIRRTVRAARVAGPLESTLAADSAEWAQAQPTYVALMQLWWRLDSIDGVLVRALHDGKRVAIRLTWVDSTEDRLSLRTEQFGDGAAIQLSAAESPPLFAMGSADAGVDIWHWKAQWQDDLSGRRDVEQVYPRAVVDHTVVGMKASEAGGVALAGLDPSSLPAEFVPAAAAGNIVAALDRTTSVAALAAKGFGSLTVGRDTPQVVDGSSSWDRGVWDVVFVRDLAPGAGAVALAPGSEIEVAFAVWDGDAGDRDGQKSVTIWHALTLDR